MPTSWSPSAEQQLPFDHAWLELSRNRHIFVCTHGSRDQLCGVHGTNLLAELRSLIAGRKLSRNLAAWATSHVGGHKFAANAIVYPRGDWYATWCEKCNAAAHPATSSPAAAEAILLEDFNYYI
ncbi:hypothetical protein GGI04_000910 [Coemansia thaxteri]|nr:hypothetical protein GGI04_000910 [Coemansia thaxteri]